MNNKKLKKLPVFKTEDEEREFWTTHSSVDYIDWSQAVHAKFPNLRLTSKPITLRLPLELDKQLHLLRCLDPQQPQSTL